MNRALKSPLFLCQLSGWKRCATLFVLGAFLTLSFAPFFFWQSAVISLTLLLLFIEKADAPKQAFKDGWWFGWGHFSAGLYWFAHALLTDAEQFAWLIPFAIFGIPAVLAIYTGLTTYLSKRIAKTSAQLWLSFALCWVGLEFLRAHLFSGFPWNLLGYVWGVNNITIQSASVFGVWGLSLITALIASVPFFLIRNKANIERSSVIFVVTSVAFLISLLAFGANRLSTIPQSIDKKPHYVRLVQGNVAQHHKWNPAFQMDIFRTYVELSKQPAKHPLSLIVWPESAMPFIPNEQKWVKQVIADTTPENAFLMTGALRIERDEDYSAQSFAIWNSLYAFNSNGEIVTYYDKTHLVPFGEYIPLRSILPLTKITAGSTDFSQGTGVKTLKIPSLPSFSPLICYEIIFPDKVISQENKPDWMINITNDAWFGDSTGPYQHLQMARFRAAEEGRPLIRAANTGVSAVFDGFGRTLGALNLNEKGIVDIKMPTIEPINTMYQKRYGLILLFLFVSVTLIILKIRKL